MNRSDAEVGDRIQCPRPGELLGAFQPASDAAAGIGVTSGPDDLFGHVFHLGTGLQIPLAGPSIQVADVDRDEATDGVQDVHHPGLLGFGVTHGIGEDGLDPSVVSPTQHPGSERQRQGTDPRPVGDPVGDRRQVAHHLGVDAGSDDVLPAPQHLVGQVGAASGDGPTTLGVGSEQHHNSLAVLLDLGQIEYRSTPFAI